MKVLKFGGSSIATPERIKQALRIVASQVDDEPRAIVVSALGGVTDELINIARLAIHDKEQYRPLVEGVRRRHLETLKELLPEKAQEPGILQLDNLYGELADVLQGLHLVGEVSIRCLDFVMSFGELLSATIFSEALKAEGHDCKFLDARQVIRADNTFGEGKVDFNVTNSLILDHFNTHPQLQIVTGFIASTPNGETITLGRGGSDYTASIVAAAINASEIQIWTDVDGLMTADPRKVKSAFCQSSVTYREAMELSHFGAKVIYPPTLQPALAKRIPIRVLNTFRVEFDGTLLSDQAYPQPKLVSGISSIEEIALLRVEGSGMLGVAGAAERLFGALARAKVAVILISQSSSQQTICCAIRPAQVEAAVSVVEQEFSREMEAERIDQVVVKCDLSIVSVVGENMARMPGVAGRVFGALGRNGVNVVAIAQGSSERNISAVIAAKDELKALNVLHEEFFFPDTRSINVFLVGTGLIGGALLGQIEAQQPLLKEEHLHEVRVVGITNTSKMLFNEEGIELKGCTEQLTEKGEAALLEQFVKRMRGANMPNSVFVDCTASEALVELYPEILAANISIVTPNKKAQSGPQGSYDKLKRLALRRNTAFLYETSVGAGLPVLGTLNDLLKSGDRIISIEAVLSGTLSYIFNTFRTPLKFSEVVEQAKAAGYTEPDPRDDLNGLDVARKILILARESGLQMEMADVDVENLVPPPCRESSSVEEFLAKLKEYDQQFEELRASAEKEGKKLCYMASLKEGKASVKLSQIGAEHPFFNLSGSDNMISFTTARYFERPLVVKGPGAGAQVTAAGVFADIIRLAG